jgi:hypothetical protein
MMTRLTAKARKKIPASKFAIAGRRFPVDTKARARLALRMIGLGKNLTAKQKATIRRRAKAKLAGK